MNTKGDYAKNSDSVSCSKYEGRSADEWCYRPPEPDDGSSTNGAAEETSGGSGGGESSASGAWKCQSQWHVQGTAQGDDAKDWTIAHNVYRCMHGIQFVKWSNPMAANIEAYLAPLTDMKHDHSYDLSPPEGPSGENLFWGSPASYWKVGHAVQGWYSEVSDCQSLPGCTSSKGGQVGHFTAMNWAGVKEIGCTSNSHGLKGCRYKGNDNKDCTTPNMGGCYKEQVPPEKTSYNECKKKVLDCFGVSSLPTGVTKAFAFNATLHVPQEAHITGSATVWTVWVIAIAMVSSAGALALLLRTRRAATRPQMLDTGIGLTAAEEIVE
jgi:hypothetical protein